MKKYLTPTVVLERISSEDIMTGSMEPQMIDNVGTVVPFWMGEEMAF